MTDKQARFEAIARKYSADMYRYAMWISGDHALAKDVVQEAFVRAWKALDKLNDEKAIKGWLFTIVRREYLRTYNTRVVEPTPSTPEQLRALVEARAGSGR